MTPEACGKAWGWAVVAAARWVEANVRETPVPLFDKQGSGHGKGRGMGPLVWMGRVTRGPIQTDLQY